MAQTFDTLAATKRMAGTGMAREQAEAVAETVADAQRDLVTKVDLEAANYKLEARLTWRLVGIAAVIVAAVKFIPPVY